MLSSIFYALCLVMLVSCSAEKSNANSPTSGTNIIEESSSIDNVEIVEDEEIDSSDMNLLKIPTTEAIITDVEVRTSSTVATKSVKASTKIVEPSKATFTKPGLVNTETIAKEVNVSNPVLAPDTDLSTNVEPVSQVVEKSIPVKVEEVIETVKTEAKISHDSFNALLIKHVSASGKVNYKGLKSDISKLDAYLAKLESTNINDGYSKDEQLAYWINAYNAYTIKLIVTNYPVKSITDLHGGKPWDKKWININGKTLSLNNIENDIIRPNFKEPRIHFAVNCAATSCPPLLNAAYNASTLKATLLSQAKKFINNKTYNEVGTTSMSISKIFEWYAVDFGDITTYINKYSSTQAAPSATVSYKDYDWSLNE